MATSRNTNEVGFVVEAKQYVLTLEGLPSVKVNELISQENGGRAIVRSLSGEQLTALSLDYGSPRAGDRWGYLQGEHLYSLGDHLFGRIINVLGEPADGGDPFPAGNTPLILDIDAPGIEVRAPIEEQFQTGIMVVDTLLPIAKGQRQLLFGPVRQGKTDFLLDIVLNQESQGAVCIYTVVGKSLSELERIERKLLRESKGKNIIIAALSDQPSPRIWLAPSVAFMIADYFQKQGKDVLVVLDDLDVHAKYLREIELLENRLPGRESYPGDLFYEHAHLMERCGRFIPSYGGGTITALPVISTDPNAALGIVSTNLMSCTDGHYSFVSELQAEGIYPAIAQEQSITRIGRNAQKLLSKQLSVEVRLRLSEADRQRQYAQFGAQASKTVEATLHQGDVIEAMLKQEPFSRIPSEIQIPLLSLTLTPFLLEQEANYVSIHKEKLIAGLLKEPDLKKLVDSARTDTPLYEYLKLITSKRAVFERICRL
jgi:F-type H+/Na+-transporting ATPase subunit alpha